MPFLPVTLSLFAIAAPPPVDYNRDIKPILAKNCYACHGPDDGHREANLRLDDRASAVKARRRPALVPGDPAKSHLLLRITTTDEAERMPPAESGDPLSAPQVELLRRWIAQGAEYAEHWAFVPPKRSPLPSVTPAAWPRAGLDHFILERLTQAGLKPSPPADRFTLLRRVSLDLRGLPPTPEDREAFAADSRPDAYERMVDRFLADPAYGERWARVWLDLGRYADSAGYGSDPLRPHAWRWRQWVIEAYNRNLPSDQFTIEQLAGDLLPNATQDQKLATGFHRNTMTNTEGGTDDEEFRVAAVKDRVDTTFQVWMGLTVGCAKCHNHKYDPVSQLDYYRSYAIFNQTADADRGDESPTMPTPTPEQERQLRDLETRLAALRKQIDTPTPEITKAQSDWEASLRPEVVGTPLTVEAEKDGVLTLRVPKAITSTGFQAAGVVRSLHVTLGQPGPRWPAGSSGSSCRARTACCRWPRCRSCAAAATSPAWARPTAPLPTLSTIRTARSIPPASSIPRPSSSLRSRKPTASARSLATAPAPSRW